MTSGANTQNEFNIDENYSEDYSYDGDNYSNASDSELDD